MKYPEEFMLEVLIELPLNESLSVYTGVLNPAGVTVNESTVFGTTTEPGLIAVIAMFAVCTVIVCVT